MSRGLIVVCVALYLTSVGALLGAGSRQGASPPMVFAGRVTVAGTPAPDGLEIYAKLQGRRTGRTFTLNGEYKLLAVAPIGEGGSGETITFWASWDSRAGLPEVQAEQTTRYTPPSTQFQEFILDLTFPALPARTVPDPGSGPTPTLEPPILAPIPGDPALPRAASVALVAGAVLLVGGIGGLVLVRRRVQ